jgi:hypothetical protein
MDSGLDNGRYTLAPEKAVTPLQMRKIKHLSRNMSRYKPSCEAVTRRETGAAKPARAFFYRLKSEWSQRHSRKTMLIPMSVQDETNSLVLRAAGFVARSLQITADMRLARASPAARNPARFSLILNAHWN